MLACVELKRIIFKCVSSQRARAFLDVVFGVGIPFAKYEKLHQFARKIFIRSSLATLVIVEIFQHRRIAQNAHDQLRKIANSIRSKKLVLQKHVITIFDCAIPSRKVSMPKQRHLFLKWTTRFDHAAKPPLLHFLRLLAVESIAFVSQFLNLSKRIFIIGLACLLHHRSFFIVERPSNVTIKLCIADRLRWERVIIEQVIHRTIRPHRDECVDLCACPTKASSIEQMPCSGCIPLRLADWTHRKIGHAFARGFNIPLSKYAISRTKINPIGTKSISVRFCINPSS